MADKSTTSRLDASLLTTLYTTEPRPYPSPNSPEVRLLEYHTDHMIIVSWNVRTGWSIPCLQPYGPIPMSPAASALQYSTECFEGLKLNRGPDGQVRLFRSIENCSRMRRSAARVALPDFEAAELERLIISLCALEAPKWLPKDSGEGALYIRPTLIGTDPALATLRPRSAMLVIFLTVFPKAISSITGPEAPQKQVQPPRRSMKLLASDKNEVHAWPGGSGQYKVGANYGTALVSQDQAKAQGFDQILWLFGSERYVTEAGASNFFFVLRTGEKTWQLITAPLDEGLILPGITRACVLQLARERLQQSQSMKDIKVEVVERQFTMAELFEAHRQGNIIEAFVTGTALFVTPVCIIRADGQDLKINCEPVHGVLVSRLVKDWLIGTMNGSEEHEWAFVVNEVRSMIL